MGADIKGQTMAALPGTLDAMNEQSSKACTKCGAVNLLSEFGTDKRNRDGRRSHCKACRRKDNDAYRRANMDWAAERQLAWANRNRDKCRQFHNAWKDRNKDNVLMAEKVRNAEQVALASPSYCAGILGIATAELTPELHAMKREQLTTHRLARQLKEKANESSTDPR